MDVENIVLVITLKDRSAQGPAVAALDSLARCDAVYPGWLAARRLLFGTLDIREGGFTGQELQHWLTRLREVAGSHFWAIEVDPVVNHVWVGANSEIDQAAVLAAAAGDNIPTAAVVVEAPPADSTPGAFRILGREVTVQSLEDIFGFTVVVDHQNTGNAEVFQDRCVLPAVLQRSEPLARLEKWEPSGWRTVHRPFCDAVLPLTPISVPPGGSRTDTINVTAARRLNVVPRWQNVRVAGTYRFVVPLFRSTTGFPPQLVDQLPDSLGRSETFRLRLEF